MNSETIVYTTKSTAQGLKQIGKYRCGDKVKVINSDTVVTIKGIRGSDYFIGDFWDYPEKPEYSYRIGSSLYIKEQYLENCMQYKVGDIVWYLDIHAEPPQIRRDVIKSIAPNNYHIGIEGVSYLAPVTKFYQTKEALLAAIDPPVHNFVVGQTVWYVENEDDDNTIRVEKATVISTTYNTVEIDVSHPCVPNFTIDDLSIIFASPRDAIEKALELKQW